MLAEPASNRPEARLILILTPTTAQVGGSCDPRKILVISANGTATFVEPYALDLANDVVLNGTMSRKSPERGSCDPIPL